MTPKNENRLFFLLEIFNKLSIHIPAIQKFFNFKSLTSEFAYSSETKVMDKIWVIINMNYTFDSFNVYTKLSFKLIQNLASNPKL